MKSLSKLFTTLAILSLVSCKQGEKEEKKTPDQPNIILIYADDLGYGDLATYGGEIATPNIDKLADEGIKQMRAYATAATCTPSRYSMLTGEYAWRRKGTGIAPGDATALIHDRPTVPSLLKKAGYNTAAVGKWHLGIGPKGEKINWNGEIEGGPLSIGFDYCYIMPATSDRVPCVFIENKHIENLDPNDPIEVSYGKEKIGDWPTGKENPELLKLKYSYGHDKTIVNGISRIGYQKGGKSALWRDEDIADSLVSKSIKFIERNKEKPFFLYLATNDVHVPRMPHERFQGTTEQGLRGDAVKSLDYTVGAIRKALDSLNLADNTIIIFTSDNGPVLDDGYADKAAELTGSHNPFGGLRGGKYSTYEAGTRVPMILYWKDKIKAGTTSNALISQIDLMANLAGINHIEVDTIYSPDTKYQWNAWIGKDSKGREGLIQEAIFNVLSYVTDEYKYIQAHEGPKMVPWGVDIETGFSNEEKLFNILKDPAEQNNIAKEFPEITERMAKALQEQVDRGKGQDLYK